MIVKLKAGSATLQVNVECECWWSWGDVPDVIKLIFLLVKIEKRDLARASAWKVSTTCINYYVTDTNSISFLLRLYQN
jgi:hypothetical protein